VHEYAPDSPFTQEFPAQHGTPPSGVHAAQHAWQVISASGGWVVMPASTPASAAGLQASVQLDAVNEQPYGHFAHSVSYAAGTHTFAPSPVSLHDEPAPHSLAATQTFPHDAGGSQVTWQPNSLQVFVHPVHDEHAVGKHFLAPLDEVWQVVPAQQSA
jgi:hypothetical protein